MDPSTAETGSTAANAENVATDAQNTDSAAGKAADLDAKTAETTDKTAIQVVTTDSKTAQTNTKKPDSDPKKAKSEAKKTDSDPKKAANTTKGLDATKKVVEAALDLAKTSETAAVGPTTTIKVLRSHPKLGAWPGAVTTIPAALAAELIAGEFAREASSEEQAQVETSGYTETL